MVHLKKVINYLAKQTVTPTEIPQADIIRIYELTYKLQMLQQEEKLGDYGQGWNLPDNAYIELNKLKVDLSTLLNWALKLFEQWFAIWLDFDPDVAHDKVSIHIEDVYNEIKNFSSLDLSQRIVLFQDALTTIHYSGIMAGHIIQGPATNISALLKSLSSKSNPYVPKWDQDLTKLLGHPPGSTIAPPKDVWIQPASKRLARVIQYLKLYQSNVS